MEVLWKPDLEELRRHFRYHSRLDHMRSSVGRSCAVGYMDEASHDGAEVRRNESCYGILALSACDGGLDDDKASGRHPEAKIPRDQALSWDERGFQSLQT